MEEYENPLPKKANILKGRKYWWCNRCNKCIEKGDEHIAVKQGCWGLRGGYGMFVTDAVIARYHKNCFKEYYDKFVHEDNGVIESGDFTFLYD